jgi:ABC-type sugar transport system ATPase subunit
MLLDEPLSNLDASLREEMRFELKRIQIETGVTTVLVTHDQVEAMELAQVIGVMDQGKLLQIGDAENLYNSPKNQFVASFLGFINYIEGTLTPANSQSMVCDLGSFSFSVEMNKIPDEAKSSGKVLVGIRPETIRCSGSNLSLSSIQAKAKVRDITFFGNRLEAHIDLLVRNISDPSIRVINIRAEEWQQALSDGDRNDEQLVSVVFDPSTFQFFPVQSISSASK